MLPTMLLSFFLSIKNSVRMPFSRKAILVSLKVALMISSDGIDSPVPYLHDSREISRKPQFFYVGPRRYIKRLRSPVLYLRHLSFETLLPYEEIAEMAVPCPHGTNDGAEDPHASGQVRVDARNQGGVDRFRPFRLHLHHLAGALDADGERGGERDAGLGMVLPVHLQGDARRSDGPEKNVDGIEMAHITGLPGLGVPYGDGGKRGDLRL